MKRRLYLIIPLSLQFLLGCETERLIYRGPDFVRFTESSLVKKESYTPVIQLQVHRVGKASSEDVTVRYSIAGSARPGIDYTISDNPGIVTIPKDQYFGYVDVQLINNSNNILRKQDILFTLESADQGLQIGQGESAIGRTFTFTILDDCILGGTYTGARSGVVVEGINSTSADCDTYTISNWNIAVFNSPVEMDLQFIDNGDNTLTIPTQEETMLPADLATISGSGVVDPLTRKITLTITLEDFSNQPQYTITYTPQ